MTRSAGDRGSGKQAWKVGEHDLHNTHSIQSDPVTGHSLFSSHLGRPHPRQAVTEFKLITKQPTRAKVLRLAQIIAKKIIGTADEVIKR